MSGTTRTRALNLRPHEARRLAECGDVLCVRVVKPQPIDRTAILLTFTGEAYRWAAEDRVFRCPFGRVGDESWGREAWSPDHKDFYPHFAAVYKADGTVFDHEIEDGKVYSPETNTHHNFRWRPATAMPRHASRFPRLVVESVECRRLKSVTPSEAERAGFRAATYRDGRGHESARVDLMYQSAKLYGPTAWADDVWCWFATMRRVEL